MDLIDRQAAIDALDKIFPADPMRNDYTQGITCGAALAETYIEQLPSVQSEIIRCKDCKYSYAMITAKSKDGQERWIRFCDKHKNWYPKDDWFCKDGEREKNEDN